MTCVILLLRLPYLESTSSALCFFFMGIGPRGHCVRQVTFSVNWEQLYRQRHKVLWTCVNGVGFRHHELCSFINVTGRPGKCLCGTEQRLQQCEKFFIGLISHCASPSFVRDRCIHLVEFMYISSVGVTTRFCTFFGDSAVRGDWMPSSCSIYRQCSHGLVCAE
jgi:hypothetical protein